MADLVKRVIGLPGETISLTKGHVRHRREGASTRPGSPRRSRARPSPVRPGTPYNLAKPYVIPANHYFVMGDNRTESCDSRYWGPISRSLIVGKVDVRVWPVTAFHFF